MSQAFSKSYYTLHTRVILLPWLNPEAYRNITPKTGSLTLFSTQKSTDKTWLAQILAGEELSSTQILWKKKTYL